MSLRKQMPKISIIVPIYNMEKTLQRSIDSILIQSYKDFEVLLINDGSTDNCGIICDEYAMKDSRVRVIHKENGGLSSARNTGMELAKGEWITFCDSDDWVYPKWLDNFNLINSEEYDLIGQGIECDKPLTTDEHETSPFRYSFNFEGDSINALNALYIHNIMGYTVIKAYRRNIIQKYGLTFDTQLRLQEDEVFLYQYLKHSNKVRIYDTIGYYYYIPDWNKKYNLSFEERELFLLKSIKYACDLDSDTLTVIKSRRLELSQLYYNEFCKNKQNRNYCISQLHKLLIDDFRHSQIFYPTRALIRFDKSKIISTMLLILHLNIKRMFKI